MTESGLAVTGAASALFYRLARRLSGAPAAWLATSLLVFSPTVILYDTVASSYPADLFTSTLLGAMAARLWLGDKRSGPRAAVAIALLAGARQSGAVMMAPLVVSSLARAYRLDARRWALTVLAGGGALAAWYAPTARMSGGISQYQSITRNQLLGSFRTTSVFFGAPAAQHLTMLRMNAAWAAAAIGVAAATTATSFPDSRPAFDGVTTRMLESDLGDEALDAHVHLDRTYHLARASAAAPGAM